MLNSIFQPTVVLDSYWRFIAERHAIYLKRLRGESAPWTSDTILQQHKFTNVFRACDRVSQFLIEEVIYHPADPTEPQEYVFRRFELHRPPSFTATFRFETAGR